MAIRRPLKLDASNNLRDMTSAEVDLIIDETIRLYGSDPSVVLTVSSGSGNLSTLSETRSVAGALATGSSPWPSAPATSTTTVDYDNTLQTIGTTGFPHRGSTTYENYSYPVYRTVLGHLKAMSKTDIYDTFIQPAIARLVSSSTTESQAGTYFISTSSSESGATLVSSTPIAVDTNADITAFASGSLPETIDQPDTVTNFYLHRIDSGALVNYIPPMALKIDTNDLIASPKAGFQPMLLDLIKHHAANTIRYDYYISTDTSFGVVRGTGITDTYTTGSTTRYEQPNPTTYYAQNVPSGTPTTQSVHYLRIGTI